MFIDDIKSSLYDPLFYTSLKGRKLFSSFRYFFSLVALLAVALAFVFGVELAPAFSAENLRKLVDFYPEELTIQIKSGAIATNVSEPYFIKESAGYRTAVKYGNLAVIDTKNDFSVATFKSYDTRFLIGKNFIVTAKGPDRFEFNDLSRLPDFSLSQEKLFHWSDLVAKNHLLISFGLFALLFLAFFGFFIIKLLGLLIIALIILLLAKLKQVSLSYKNCYQISLHALTFPLTLQAVFIIADTAAPFPFFFSVILLAIAFVNIVNPADSLPKNAAA
ncbi:MAG: DUF1189 family protein [Candidatus Taylorbacteria bacterium]|nr:DUF1189 family protein [Candidatus Taylorbacteria bacterium]